MGVVALTGKSLARASATARGAALAGSSRASTPPQVIERNGEPSASSVTMITTT